MLANVAVGTIGAAAIAVGATLWALPGNAFQTTTWRQAATPVELGAALAALCFVLLIGAVAAQFLQLVQAKVSSKEPERRLAEITRELETVNVRLDAVLNNMSQGLCIFDNDQNLMVFNARFARIYGLPGDVIRLGCKLADTLRLGAEAGFHWDDLTQYAATLTTQIAEGKRNSLDVALGNGRVIAIINQPLSGGGWVATHEDITERLRSQARIAHMVDHDTLTDLPNHVLFSEKVNGMAAGVTKSSRGFAVLVFDLDLFKTAKNSLGHAMEDALLKAVAVRLRSCTGKHHVVGRLGGEEFAVLQASEADPRQEADVLAELLMRTIGAPYEIDGDTIDIGIGIGIALAPGDGRDSAELMENADLALCRAKSEGRSGYRFFEPEMNREARLRRTLESDLRNALLRNEFEIHYQLVLDIASRQPCGAEALVRWRHPQHGLIGPDRFIPLAEDIGIIIPLGEWVLRHACREAAKWPATIKLAVNLSPVQFRSPSLVNVVSEALAESRLAAERLELEVTESVLLQKDVGNVRILNQLSALGIGIALDDFGTGYSSLSYLRMYKFSKIKIDKSFVAELSHQADCAAIVCAVTGLAHNLGVTTTAEGVETWEQFELVRAAGCSQAQGYLFSRPAPASELNFSAPQCRRRDENVA